MEMCNNRMLANFISFVTQNLIPFDSEYQMIKGSGHNLWCFDWWVIEVSKFIYLGEYDYLRFRPPRRLRNNSNYVISDIIRDSNLRLSYVCAVESYKDKYDLIVVSDYSRGLDSLLARLVVDKPLFIIDDDTIQFNLIESFFNTNKLKYNAITDLNGVVNENSLLIVNNSNYMSKYNDILSNFDRVVDGVFYGKNNNN